eukprot:2845235-Amphidinium_carterae.1
MIPKEEGKTEEEESCSQSMFDRSEVSNNASMRASCKGQGKITHGKGTIRRRPSIADSSAS